MKHKHVDHQYRFLSIFDDFSGVYIRSNVIDEQGNDTGVDPFMASFPHLIDVGIMGHCAHGKAGLCVKAGIGCYQSGLVKERPNMIFDDFSSIISQCRGKVHQIALGGRGDPDQHENFESILVLCRQNTIVPNFTTSGYGMTKELADICKQYCGAVAVSWYRSDYTLNAISMLLRSGVKTNIHYVLGRNSIDEAIKRLTRGDFPEGINAVIFLLHKPAGQGMQDNVLNPIDQRIREFFKLVDKGGFPFKVGMDSCCVPGLINYSRNVISEAFDTCEGARFSCYIDTQMNMMPCSFDQVGKFEVSLRDHTIEEAWDSQHFESFRENLRVRCPNCRSRFECMGGCPLY
ncbi:MAG: radical SAM protein, partial [Clostridiales bacterium]|nr:radical SAM protein [Clostridiales bacterium]